MKSPEALPRESESRFVYLFMSSNFEPTQHLLYSSNLLPVHPLLVKSLTHSISTRLKKLKVRSDPSEPHE